MSTGINIAPSSDITVGTTAVTSGTNGRVFFQAGGVVQQDANFTYDNTLKRLGLKAAGTAATDIPFQIQNSAGTLNFLEIRGDNQFLFTNNSNGVTLPFTIKSTDNNSAPYIRAISNGDISEASLIATRTGGSGVTATAINRGFVQLANSGGNLNVLSSNGGFAFSIQPVSGYNPTSDQMRLLNGNLSIGTGYTGTARLDVRAQGALSTDIAFRVRNSADTANIMTVLGTSDVYIGATITQAGQGHLFNIRNAGSTSIPFAYFDNNSYNFDVDRFCNIKLGFGLIAANSTQSLALGLGTLPSSRNFQQTIGILTAISQGTNDSGFAMSGADTAGNNAIYTNYYGRNIVLGGTTQGTGTRKIVLNNGTEPTTNLTDAFQAYSADITAGNAAPHFRTEAGDIIKLYKQSSAGITTVADLVTVLTNLGLLG